MTHDSVRQGSARLIPHLLQTVSASLGAFIAISVWGVSGYGVGHGGPSGPGDAPARVPPPPPPIRRSAVSAVAQLPRDGRTA